jgi:CMP-N,N'-diacetyllegionaminic acid synthase
MIGDQRVLAVVPARGGSKGLPGKNLRPFCGVPFVGPVGRVIAGLPQIDRAVVSTDSADIAAAAKTHGIDAPFMRPDALSGDIISDVDVLVHALQTCEQIDGCRYGVVVMLQPTSPLRTSAEVAECLEVFARNDAESVWTVSAADKKYHPLKQLKVQEGGKMSYYDPRGPQIIARQQLDDLHFRNGVAYVLSRALLLERRTLLGERAYACVSRVAHISIDTAEDLAQAEAMARQRGWPQAQ